MKNLLKRFVKDEQGLELSEYAIMIALILVIAVGAIIAVGNKIDSLFDDLLNALKGTAPSA